jgi:hypothetical protein
LAAVYFLPRTSRFFCAVGNRTFAHRIRALKRKAFACDADRRENGYIFVVRRESARAN